jgi:uncharacterized membrane protein YfcA
MPLIAIKIIVGFVVGVLIGLSGVGGGVLLLPILIFGLRVPPIVAVGSDALFNFFTKIPAGLLHLKKGTVRRKVVISLALGSIPGSICGVALLTHIRALYGDGVNSFIKTAVGLLLIVIPTLLLFQKSIEERVANRPPTVKNFAGMAVYFSLPGPGCCGLDWTKGHYEFLSLGNSLPYRGSTGIYASSLRSLYTGADPDRIQGGT